MAEEKIEMKMVSPTTAIASFNPDDCKGAVVVPNVNASTFAFPKAEDGEIAFAHAYGLTEKLKRLDPDGTHPKHDIYSRLSNSSVRACEEMMRQIERTGPNKKDCADYAVVLPSGMAALNVLVRASCFQSLGDAFNTKHDVIVHSTPLYGGTHALFYNIIQRWGFTHVPVDFTNKDELRAALMQYGDRIGLVYCETPANPTLTMIDIAATRALMDEVFAGKSRPALAVDNTFMGIFQQPLALGADVVLYSATKYLGGHSDLIAGFLVGKKGPTTMVKPFIGEATEAPLEAAIMGQRTIGGYTTSSDVAQRLWTHMQTYVVRMNCQAEVAKHVVDWLITQPKEKVINLRFPTLLTGEAKKIFERQCLGHGAMIAFAVASDSQETAFRFLNALKHCVRAVSLGSVRTLVDHPATWTHSDIDPESQLEMSITPGMIRLSIGIEDPEDIIADLAQALAAV